MRTFTFNTESPDCTTALVKSVANPSALSSVGSKIGEIQSVTLCLASPSTPTGYDPVSGVNTTAIVAAVGSPAGLPTSGSYTLSFNAASSSALAYNVTAAQLQTALEAVSGIGAGNILITGSFPSYNAQFIGSLALAAQSLIQVNSALLSAQSIVSIGRVQAGSGAQNEIQSITLQVLPAVFQTSWTQSSDSKGWTGTLSFTSAALIQLFTPGQPYIDETLEFKLTAVDGSVSKYSCPIKIYNSVTQVAGVGSGTPVSLTGIASIGNGADQGTVSGLNLLTAPRGVEISVMVPTGGLNIFATVDIGSITTGGFTFNLSGVTDSSGYKMLYTLIF